MKYEPKSLIEIIDEGLAYYPKGLLVSTKRDGKWHNMSVEEFQEKVRLFGLGLYKLGVQKGDKVSIHSENRTEWLIADQAILSIGAANVPIYTTQPGDQIKYILENSETKVHIVSNDEMFADTKPIIKKVKSVKAIITFDKSKHKKLKHFDDIIKLGREQHEEIPGIFNQLKLELKPDTLATLIYTSGTTGTPKGVMLTHNNISHNVRAAIDRMPFRQGELKSQNVLSYLPLSHVFERLMSYMYFCMGAKIYFIEDIEEIRDDFQTVKPWFMATVPRLMEKIQTGVKVRGQELSGIQKNLYYWAVQRTEKFDPDNPPKGLRALQHKIADKLVYNKIRKLFGGELRAAVSGGAALSPEVFCFINAIGIFIGQGYGLTETSPVVSVQERGNMKIGSSGKPLPDVSVKIAGDGEIIVKGPNVMKGYYKMEEQTKEVLTEDGWFKTGDIGKLDETGNLYITDRKKSVFKLSTGKYVAPQNVENQILNSGFIDQIVVLGYSQKFCSALIVPAYQNVKKRLKRDGYTPKNPLIEDEKVKKLIQSEVEKFNVNLAPWEQVKKFELLEEPLTIESGDLTPTMKVKRSVVLEKYADLIDRMYKEE
ncbi:MAG: AMP-dependent synthetase/ligase [Balneolaceae bacterium]